MRLRKDVNVYLYDPKKKHFHIVIELENVPGALHDVLEVMQGLKLNVLGSFSSVDSAAKVGVWSGFVEDSDHSAEELKTRLGVSPYVHDALVAESKGGFLVDGVHFPLAFNTGTRGVMMTSKYFARMLETMRKQFGSGGNVIVYHEGYAYGKDVGAEYLSQLGGEFMAANPGEVLKIYQALGWFRLEKVDFDRKAREGTVTTSDNFECAGSVSKSPFSHFVRGHLAGVMTSLFGEDMTCKETKCVARGDPHCVFSLGPR